MRNALVVRAVVIGDRMQAALLELGLHLVGVPGLDAPGEAVEHRLHGRATHAESRIGDGGGRRRGQRRRE